MRSNFSSPASSEEGFTLIELLVVILIVGILAAIAIPSFLAQRSKGYDACAKSMASAMSKAMHVHVMHASTQTYAGVTVANLTTVENSIVTNSCGAGTTVSIGRDVTAGSCANAADATRYCVQSLSRSGNRFSIQRATNGAITRPCTRVETRGGCKGTGTSGSW
jgi:type IV pilus assembly protein PilA